MKPFLREKKTFTAAEIPEATAFEAGYLVSVNSGWRSIRPVVDTGRCIGCEQCYLYCPDGVICVKDGKAVIDYDYCKGCGICAKICKIGAIGMEAEHK